MTAQVTQDVLLVLILRSGNNNNHTVLFEVPLDPARALAVSFVPRTSSFGVAPRPYAFQVMRDDTEFTIELFENCNNVVDDIELFHNVLVWYVTDVHVNIEQLLQPAPPPTAAARGVAGACVCACANEDLRGRFVLMNDDDGEIVGTLDRSHRVFISIYTKNFSGLV